MVETAALSFLGSTSWETDWCSTKEMKSPRKRKKKTPNKKFPSVMCIKGFEGRRQSKNIEESALTIFVRKILCGMY